MNVLFTLCGRAGSKGYKNKNILNFLDKPLVYYSISTIDLFVKKLKNVLKMNYDIALNTDSDILRKIVKENKMIKDIVVIPRKDELAGDIVGKKEVIKDTYLQMKSMYNKEYDVVVDLDLTSPIRTVKDIENLLDTYKKKDVDIVFSVVKSRRNPFFNMVCKRNGKIEKVIYSSYTSRQQAPTCYDLNASLYAYNPNFLLKDVLILDGKNEIIEMKDTAVVDIDDEEDKNLMEIIAKYLIDSNSEYKEIYDNIII